MPDAYPLFSALPSLREFLPTPAGLVSPTPLELLSEQPRVWLKRDDLSSAGYGGNKVRKLDFLLADAKARGRTAVLSFGYAGSNFIAATAWHGRTLGLHTIACLLPQAQADYVADNLAVGLACGAQLRQYPNTVQVAVGAVAASLGYRWRDGRWPVWIPPGGSAPLGVAGFINAGLELAAQFESRGEAPPDVLYVAFSSMGTVAGLALGLALAGLDIRIEAVQVVGEQFASRAKLERLLAQTIKEFSRHAPAIGACREAGNRVRIRTEFFAPGYALATPATKAAMQRFCQASGARADSAYSGKALACLYADLDAGELAGKTALFWHTFNAHGRPSEVPAGPPAEVPASLAGYFAASGGLR